MSYDASRRAVTSGCGSWIVSETTAPSSTLNRTTAQSGSGTRLRDEVFKSACDSDVGWVPETILADAKKLRSGAGLLTSVRQSQRAKTGSAGAGIRLESHVASRREPPIPADGQNPGYAAPGLFTTPQMF